MVEIKSVTANSPAHRAGIKKGSFLIEINGHKIKDVLDYMFYAAESKVVLLISENGSEKKYKIVKSEYDDIGLEFETFLMDKKQSCCNKCVFCFIDQMPKGMRETLYFKDDDARLSFLQGNYVTLTNLSDEDIDRIIEMKLNVNVSVHTTNPKLRCKMMNNRFAGEKLKYLWQMADAGLSLNCQIVLCPNLNDGAELERTLNDFGKIAENISSVSVVPVGLTKFREKLYPLTTFDEKTAGETIDIIEKYQNKFLSEHGSRLVFPSDEFFLTAKRELPSADYYEDYPQYENGVGLLRSLEDEFESALKIADKMLCKRKITIATGKSPYEFIKSLTNKAESVFEDLKCQVIPIRNDFFGESITVTGLITAQDIINQLKGVDIGDNLLLSSAMIKADEPIFLDDMSIEDVERKLDTKIRIVPNDGFEFLDALLGVENS
jgi:putative radical SAM enzyme (TIGR03279 family)